MKEKVMQGKPYAGNPHVRFDEGEAASTATSRRGSLLYKIRLVGGFLLCMLSLAYAESERKVYLSDISNQSNGWQFFTEDGSKVTHSQVKNERDWEMRTTRLSGANVALNALVSP